MSLYLKTHLEVGQCGAHVCLRHTQLDAALLEPLGEHLQFSRVAVCVVVARMNAVRESDGVVVVVGPGVAVRVVWMMGVVGMVGMHGGGRETGVVVHGGGVRRRVHRRVHLMMTTRR